MPPMFNLKAYSKSRHRPLKLAYKKYLELAKSIKLIADQNLIQFMFIH